VFPAQIARAIPGFPRTPHAARGRAARAESERCTSRGNAKWCVSERAVHRVFRRGTVDPAAAYVWLGHQEAPRRQIEPPPDGPATRREQACSKRAKRFTGGRDSRPPPSPLHLISDPHPSNRTPHGWGGACSLLRSPVLKDLPDELPHATHGWHEDGEWR